MLRRSQRRSVVASWLRVNDVALRGTAAVLERELGLEHPDLWDEEQYQPRARFMCGVCDDVIYELNDSTYLAAHLTWDGSSSTYQGSIHRLADDDEVKEYLGSHPCMPSGVTLPDDWREQVVASARAVNIR